MEKIKQVHSGDRAVVYHVDIDLGKFLVIGYLDIDDVIEEYEVYWRNGLKLVLPHHEEFIQAIESIEE